ncbi:MAG: DUF1189 family protein [Candidatus Magasanikbacteria bacterium]
MFYLKAFLKSLYDFSWLRAQRNNGRQAANYVILFILLLSVGYAIYSAIIIPRRVSDVRNEIVNNIPAFHVQVKDGVANVTQLEQPYIFESEEKSVKIIVDTVSSTTEPIDAYIDTSTQDGVLFASNRLEFYDREQHQTKVQYFSEMPNFEIGKQSVISWIDGTLMNKTGIFVLALVAWFFILGIGKLVYLLVVSVIVLLVAYFGKWDEWKFGSIYTLGLFALTGPSIIVAVLSAFDVQIRYLFTVLLLGVMITAVFWKKDTDVIQKVPPKSV